MDNLTAPDRQSAEGRTATPTAAVVYAAVPTLPKGLDTCLYRDAPFIVLDEPTVALDSEA